MEEYQNDSTGSDSGDSRKVNQAEQGALKKIKKSSVRPAPFFSFPESVLRQQFRNTRFNHGYTLQLNIPFRKDELLPTQTNTLTHIPQTPKITDTSMGFGESNHWKNEGSKANQSNKNNNRK